MEAHILSTGALQVKRAGEWRTQFCPHLGCFCGDWCPLFDERDGSYKVVYPCGREDLEYVIKEDERRRE